MAYMRLGDLLIASGVIMQEQLDKALAVQKETHQRLGDVLMQNGFITERNLIDALQIQLGVEFVDLTAVSIPVELARYVPRNIARKFCVVPVKLVQDTLYLAMSDPLDFVAQEQVKAASRKKVIPMIATRQATEQAIARLYGNEGTARVIEEMKREAGTAAPDIVPAQMTGEAADSAPTIRFVNSLIERAFHERASDIHLEPQESEMVVRMRIDGLLQRLFTVPTELQSTVISRLKIMGGMNIAEHKIPQDGQAVMQLKGHEVDLRISSLPTVYGEKIVLRLLDKSNRNLDKESLGIEGRDLELYNALLKNTSGVILLVGPTGSGKSTTLYAMIRDLARDEVNIVTLEDPVEYHIPGVSQCQINEKTGIAMRSAITGHLVMSTLHTNDAISAVYRLRDIGVEPWLIASALRGVISQRLVRKICPHCKTAYQPSEEELALLGMPEDSQTTFYKGVGCPECRHTGYVGRRAAFEILMVNREVRRLVNDDAAYDELLAAAKKNGYRTMRDSCRDLVLRGITTAEEAARTINSTMDE